MNNGKIMQVIKMFIIVWWILAIVICLLCWIINVKLEAWSMIFWLLGGLVMALDL